MCQRIVAPVEKSTCAERLRSPRSAHIHIGETDALARAVARQQSRDLGAQDADARKGRLQQTECRVGSRTERFCHRTLGCGAGLIQPNNYSPGEPQSDPGADRVCLARHMGGGLQWWRPCLPGPARDDQGRPQISSLGVQSYRLPECRERPT